MSLGPEVISYFAFMAYPRLRKEVVYFCISIVVVANGTFSHFLKTGFHNTYLLVLVCKITKIKIFDDKRQHNKKVESGGKLCGTDKSQSQISSTLFRREATQNPIIITLLPARKDKPAFISD